MSSHPGPESPSERYRASAERAAEAKTYLGGFIRSLDFELDDFQREACLSLQAGRGVLVAAPTGAGKTIVGEFAIYLALQRGLKAFYTTPIKALSNQKYSELADKYGADQVGLLTGDTSINGDAPVVVMTTEVLRNMLYADSGHPGRPRLRGHGRGPLPGRPLPRRRVGGSHHPPAQRGPGGLAERHGLQRRGVRRLAGHRPRADRRDRLRAPAGAALAARDGGPEDRGPVCRRHHLRRDRPAAGEPVRPPPRPPPTARHAAADRRAPGGRLRGQPGTAVHGPGREPDELPRPLRPRRPEPAPPAQRSAAATTPRRAASAARSGRPAGRRSSPAWTGRTCCRPSPSSSPAPAATPPWPSASRPGSG